MHLKISAAIPEISNDSRISNAPEYDKSVMSKDLVIAAPRRKSDVSSSAASDSGTQQLPEIQVTDITANGTRMSRVTTVNKPFSGSLSSSAQGHPKDSQQSGEVELPKKLQSFGSFQNFLSSSCMQQVLTNIPDFNWSVFELFEVAEGHCLPALSMHVFQKEGLFSSLSIQPENFLNFILALERSYHNDLPCKY
jgi:hypothetical protein